MVAHVRRLEEALIRACAELGLATTRIEGRSGVWVLGAPKEERAALGGLSLDLDPRLGGDDAFDPRLAGPEYAPPTRDSATRTASSPPSASGSPRASPCTASRST